MRWGLDVKSKVGHFGIIEDVRPAGSPCTGVFRLERQHMADVRIRFGALMGSGARAYSPIPKASAKITSSITSQATTIEASTGDFLTVKSIGGAVAFAIGPAPVAIATSGDVILSGETVDFGPLKIGDKVAIIDVV